MSWGERSCKHKPCPIPDECTMFSCNVDCRMYEWDGITKPDSYTNKQEIILNESIKPKLNREQRRALKRRK